MRWQGNRESDNVEDVRGESGGGGGGGFGIGGRSVGLGTVAIAVVAGWIFGINPLTVLSLLSGGGGAPTQQSAPAAKPPADDQEAKFMSAVLADTEDTWSAIFQENSATYQRPKLVLFRGSWPTACGTGQAAMGPFYCPGDQKVYIDLSFYDTLKRDLGSPGDFAQAYVIAHEVGHHVQSLLGVSLGFGLVVFRRLDTREIFENRAHRLAELLQPGERVPTGLPASILIYIKWQEKALGIGRD
eukprot:gene40492-53546_t